MTGAASRTRAAELPSQSGTIGFVERFCYVAPLAITQIVVYWLLNHYPLFRSRKLPLTWLDRATPFWIGTVWAYFALIAMAILLPLGVCQRQVFRRLLRAYGISAGMAALAFLVWPTHYPRPPLPSDDSWSSCRLSQPVGI